MVDHFGQDIQFVAVCDEVGMFGGAIGAIVDAEDGTTAHGHVISGHGKRVGVNSNGIILAVGTCDSESHRNTIGHSSLVD